MRSMGICFQNVLLGVLALIFIGPVAEARDLCNLPDGTSVFMYYRPNPRTDIGPAYTCREVVRLRTCMRGVLSEDAPECLDRNSGACHAGWIEQLPDSEFRFPTCAD